MLSDEQASPEQIAVFKAMTGQQRLELVEQLYGTARELKAAGIRHQYPDWTEEQVNERVRQIFTNGRT